MSTSPTPQPPAEPAAQPPTRAGVTSLSAQNPWPGLRSFTEDDREFFFGRERETAELAALVQRAPAVVLYGQSGLGKTSIVQAGLFPVLKQADFLPLRLRLDHGENAPPLARQMLNALTAELDRAQINAPRPDANETLWEYFHRQDVDFWGARNRLLTPVLVLDQFEEAFTLGQRNERAAARVAAFTADLESLLEHRPPDAIRARLEADPDQALRFDLQKQAVKIVLSLREDFLPHLDSWRARLPSLMRNRVRLERMTGVQALEAVQRAGKELVEPAVAQSIIDFVSTSQRRRGSGRTLEQRDVEPALLCVVCDELNRRRLARGEPRITTDVLTGEREGIIRGFYERAFEGIDARVRDWVEDELLTASGFRDRAALEDATKIGLPEAAFTQLEDRRLIHREEREGVVWLELTHDLLTDPAAMSRSSREQRRAAEAAASREADVRRQLRHTRYRATVYALLLVASVVMLFFALQMRTRAERARNEAILLQKQTEEARVETKRAADAAEANLKTAMYTAELFSRSIVQRLRTESRSPTSAGEAVVTDSLRELDGYVTQFPNSGRILLARWEAMALAAPILCDHGLIKEAQALAEKTLSLLDGQPRLRDGNQSALIREVETYYGLGLVGFHAGKWSDARTRLQKAIELADPELQGNTVDPDLARAAVLSRLTLAELDTNAYRLATAQTHIAAVRTLLGRQPTATGTSYTPSRWQAELTSWSLLAARAESINSQSDSDTFLFCTKAHDLATDLVRSHPENFRWKRLLAEMGYRLGTAALELKRFSEASQFITESKTVCDSLIESDPTNLEWEFCRLQTMRRQILLWQALGTLAPAREAVATVEEKTLKLLESQPDWFYTRNLRAMAMYFSAELATAKTAPEASELKLQRLRLSAEMFDQIAAIAPEDVDMRRSALVTRANLAIALTYPATPEAWKAGVDLFTELLPGLAELKRTSEEKTEILEVARWITTSRADYLSALGRFGEAVASYREAVVDGEKLLQLDPKSVSYQQNLTRLHLAIGNNELAQKHDATPEYELALRIVSDALKLSATNSNLLREKARVLTKMADMWIARGDLERAVGLLEETADARSRAFATAPLDYDIITEIQALNTKAKDFAKNLPEDTPKKVKDRLAALLTATDPKKLLLPERSTSRENNGAATMAQNWSTLPLIPGLWRTLLPAEREAELKRLTGSPSGEKLRLEDFARVRALPLNFYDNAALLEVEHAPGGKPSGVLSFIRRQDEIVILTGKSDPIHNWNKIAPIRLETADQAAGYLKFFCAAVAGVESNFRLIDTTEDLHWFPAVPLTGRFATGAAIVPMQVEPTADGQWAAKATVNYGSTIFYALFRVRRDGSIEMSTDNPAAGDLPVFLERFSDNIRSATAESEPGAELRVIIARFKETKNWPEAAKAQASYVDILLRNMPAQAPTPASPEEAKKSEDAIAQARSKLQGAQLRLSWFHLLAHNFPDALATAEAALKDDPDDLTLATNQAHALLLLGRQAEAEAIYFGNRGKRVNPGKTWEQIILDDFQELQDDGLSDPRFARIAELLRKPAR